MEIIIPYELATRIRENGTVDTGKYRYRVMPDGTIVRLPLESLDTPAALTDWREVVIASPKGVPPIRSRKTLAALKYARMSVTKLAAQKGCCRTDLSTKINRGKLTDEEMQEIAAIIGAEFIPGKFRFPDGTEF